MSKCVAVYASCIREKLLTSQHPSTQVFVEGLKHFPALEHVLLGCYWEVWSQGHVVTVQQGGREGGGEGKPLQVPLDEVHCDRELGRVEGAITVNVCQLPVEWILLYSWV